MLRIIDLVKMFYNTIKYLKAKQLYYQIFYRLRNFIIKQQFDNKNINLVIDGLVWKNFIFSDSTLKKNRTFTFLNIAHKFNESIDWNYSKYGKLWTYNLNYFDFLNQPEITAIKRIELIRDYILKYHLIKDGKEPYPTSLRAINWIKFISAESIIDPTINKFLHYDYKRLSNNIEYHLLGNHLLENGFSLLFGAYYFENEEFYFLAKKIIQEELEEQILVDGAHFELSPMYHQILLRRLLDCIQLVKNNAWEIDNLLPLLKNKAEIMLSWLETITYKDGSIPMVNDSTYNIAPRSEQLFCYASSLGLNWSTILLTESGYRKFSNSKYELFIDVGNIGPKYQPGHAHSDTFNFELYVNKMPLIVDTGISTYEKNDIRQIQRSTSSHNTVVVNEMNQSQVWGGFRVGNRANIISLMEEHNFVEASHNGYIKIGVIHKRSFSFKKDNISIKDFLIGPDKYKSYAYLHFHPNIENIILDDKSIYIEDFDISISFKGSKKIEQLKYFYSLGFNVQEKAIKLKIIFINELETTISTGKINFNGI
ncbi:alginate lyase family protein [Galbibacter sp. PAP.153]|uniref:alginate lyase family protein n=1 Tax=Galbibacter sp. PAP.153 TaxID=3104623 RepID=UPI003008F482